METLHDASRMPAAVATALLLHALLAVALVERGPMQLTLKPAPLLVDLLEPARNLAGPGEFSRELHVAAPVPPAASPPPEPVRAEPQPAVVPVPAQAKRSKPPEHKTVVASVPAEPTADRPATEAMASGGPATANGDSARSSAPEWAPTARVAYESVLFAWINRHKLYPLLAQRRGLEGSASVRVRIDRDGRVLDRSLERSTGQNLLDDAALDMVRRASPFPRVPAEYAGASFEFVAPIEYRLHRGD